MEPVYISIMLPETGNRIRSLMRQRGLSARDLQQACGFEQPQAVYKWLNGQSVPSIDNLLILGTVFGTKIENILVTSEDASVFWLFSALTSPGSPARPSYSLLFRVH